jgi:hypothetical protein
MADEREVVELAAVQRERERIIEIHRSAVMETVKMLLGAGMPGGKPYERQKARWVIKGLEMATDALRRAIDETDTAALRSKGGER